MSDPRLAGPAFSWLFALGVLGCTGTISEPLDTRPVAGGTGSTASTGGTGSGGAGGTGSSSGGSTSSGGDHATGGSPSGTGGSSGSNGGGGSGGASGASGSMSGGTAGTTTTSCNEPGDPGPAPLRLLTRSQYLNTLESLVGDLPSGLDTALGPSQESSEFGLAQGDIAPVTLESYQAAADLVAAAVVGDARRLAALVPCKGDEERACAKTFVTEFGARAYRAPLQDDADVARHLALYDAGASSSHARGIELLLRGMLQAPRFLYRVELGTDEAVGTLAVKLSGRELAARLAYAFWDAPPDDALSAEADAGALSTPEGVAERARAMLADPRGQKLVRRFLERLIHAEEVNTWAKDGTLYPDWSDDAFRRSVQTQARVFFDHVLEAQDGSLRTLLTSPTVFVDERLGDFYGVTGGKDFSAIERTDGTASGLLTLPVLLARLAKASESSPIYRGKFVREMLLCQPLPAPPANVPKPPEVDRDSSTRERLGQHEKNPACAGCHLLMDPIGFGFEHYDAIGRYRAEDGGEPVDARGEISDAPDANGTFDGVVELGERLAGSATVEDCVGRQWFRFALARFEQASDACSVTEVVDTFRDAGSVLTALPEAVVRTDAFLYRRPIVRETP